MKANKGFTLIELLVVIAIIGILSSVVLSSLNTARSKGADAAIKANLANARAQAELFYDSNTNSYDAVCTSAGVGSPSVKGINANLVAAATAGGWSTTIVGDGVAGAYNSVTCHDVAGTWVAEAPLKASTSGTPSMWCIDSTGAAKAESAAMLAGATACI